MTDIEKIKYVVENYSKYSGDKLSETLGWSKNKIREVAYRNISKENRPEIGKSKFSHRIKRTYNLNDFSFHEYSSESCYWAGLMAADGNLSSNNPKAFSLALKESDQGHIEKFKKWLNYEGKVRKEGRKYTYKGVESVKYSYSLCATSEQITKDLNDNFNILPKKTLILKPPHKLVEDIHIDAFIKGYIDGDGSIGLGKDLSGWLTITGTFDMMSWMKNRFEVILDSKITKLYKKDNIYFLVLANKKARKIISHYFNVVPHCALSRKWTSDLREGVNNFRKRRNTEHYINILNMKLRGINQTQIGKELGMTPAAISWIVKQDMFKELESAARDKGEVENEES